MKEIIVWIMAIITAFILIWVFLPHSNDSVGWQNTLTACEWCTNGSGCSCSGYATWCVEEYRTAHNLTFDEFPTHVIANDDTPPLW